MDREDTKGLERLLPILKNNGKDDIELALLAAVSKEGRDEVELFLIKELTSVIDSFKNNFKAKSLKENEFVVIDFLGAFMFVSVINSYLSTIRIASRGRMSGVYTDEELPEFIKEHIEWYLDQILLDKE